jgi:riboflavin kinase / FMN adenylyltransferase
MLVFRQLDAVPADFGPTVLSVGNFDGVHRAHQHVLREVVARARALSAKAMALTFDPHPTRILRPDMAPKLITPLPQKLALLGETGLDATLVLPFSRDLSLTTPREFAENILVQKLHAKEIHEGDNFHFGHKAEGNVARLGDFGREFGFTVCVYPEMKLRGQAVSSSNVRKLIQSGNFSRARTLLGRVFSITAPPGRGRGLGHKYTVPTINLARYDELVPGNGVYITRTRVSGELFDSVTNVGNRPTFGEESFAIETHLLNFHEIEVTAETQVELSFLKFLRPEKKWPDVDALRAQIAKDVRHARRYFHLERLLCSKAGARA